MTKEFLLSVLHQEITNLLKRKSILFDEQIRARDRIKGIANIAALNEMIASCERLIKLLEKTNG